MFKVLGSQDSDLKSCKLSAAETDAQPCRADLAHQELALEGFSCLASEVMQLTTLLVRCPCGNGQRMKWLQSSAETVAGQQLQDPGMTSSLQPGSVEIAFPHPTSCVSPKGIQARRLLQQPPPWETQSNANKEMSVLHSLPLN